MKFKGIELREGYDSEAELLVNVEVMGITDEDEMEEYVEELENTLTNEVLMYDNVNVHVETVTDNLLQVRCDDITFDKKGIELVTTIYEDIKTANLNNVTITIGVHIDGDEWFKNENGEYNEDIVSLDEFLTNIEY